MFDRAGDFNAAVQSFLDSVVAPEPEALAG
jgi:hypothetical protein